MFYAIYMFMLISHCWHLSRSICAKFETFARCCIAFVRCVAVTATQHCQAQLVKGEVPQTFTASVAMLKQFGKLAAGMSHLEYYVDCVELLRLAVSLLLQIAKIDVSQDATTTFRNDAKHGVLYQTCSFLSSFKSTIKKLQAYWDQHASSDDECKLFEMCQLSELVDPLLPVLEPEILKDAVRRECSQFDLTLQSMIPQLETKAKHYYAGGAADWKASLEDDADVDDVIAIADKTLGNIPGKVLKEQVDHCATATYQ